MNKSYIYVPSKLYNVKLQSSQQLLSTLPSRSPPPQPLPTTSLKTMDLDAFRYLCESARAENNRMAETIEAKWTTSKLLLVVWRRDSVVVVALNGIRVVSVCVFLFFRRMGFAYFLIGKWENNIDMKCQM